MRRIKNKRVEDAVRGRHDHGKTLDPRNFGGDGVHQNRTGIAGQPARHIKARSRHRRPAPAKGRTGLIRPFSVFGELAGVIGADAGRGEVEGGFVLRGNLINRFCDLFGRDAKRLRRQRDAVKFCGKVNDRRVTTGAHICDDVRHGGVHIWAVFTLGGEKCVESCLEIRGTIGQGDGHFYGAPKEFLASGGNI